MFLVDADNNKIYVDPYNYNAEPALYMPVGRYMGWRKAGAENHTPGKIFSEPVFLDTETSHDGEDCGWVHQWAAAWGENYIIGRDVLQITHFLSALDRTAALDSAKSKIVVYIHNLSYDLQYLKRYLPGLELFAIKPHRILKASWNHIEFRCSYLLTNKSLGTWAKESHSRFPKLTGEYDYDKMRFPDSRMASREWAYQLNDVAAMRESWYNDRQADGYNIVTVPLTSTGFVRDDCRKAAYRAGWNVKRRQLDPSVAVYDALEKAFAGGYTHGNRFQKNKTIIAPVGHRDFASSYPARQMMDYFPVGKWEEVKIDIDDIPFYADSYCVLFNCLMVDFQLRERKTPYPYIGYSKLENKNEEQCYLDNGRVVKYDGYCTTWLTEIDWAIIEKQYTGKFQVLTAYICPKGKLPKWFQERIMYYYRNKCTLKQADPDTYMRSKALLNGCYGMTAQKCIRPKVTYDNETGEYKETPLTEAFDRETELTKYYRKKSTFLLYGWGVYTTAHARKALFDCLDIVSENFLYCDTDSIFYLSNEETESALDTYNQQITRRAEKAGAVVEYNGKRYVLGEFLPEDDAPIRAFRFIHSKCYAEIDRDGQLKVTIAGVNKKTQVRERWVTNADELKSVDNLKPGFKFHHNGGSRVKYVEAEPHMEEINGHTVPCASAAIIIPTDYIVSDRSHFDFDDENLLLFMAETVYSDIYGEYGTAVK